MPENGQVTVPVSMRRRVGIDKGQEVYFLIPEDDPDVIQIVPAREIQDAVRTHRLKKQTGRKRTKGKSG